ncbi:hypothetical protein U1Q18_046734, partial [Sarracenia purpurea var. burkii]
YENEGGVARRGVLFARGSPKLNIFSPRSSLCVRITVQEVKALTRTTSETSYLTRRGGRLRRREAFNSRFAASKDT